MSSNASSTILSQNEEMNVDNFEQYVSIISELRNHYTCELILFRGQPCDKPLIPKLGRKELISEVSNIKLFEKEIFTDFRKRYLAYSQKVYSNNWDLLALGQHYG